MKIRERLSVAGWALCLSSLAAPVFAQPDRGYYVSFQVKGDVNFGAATTPLFINNFLTIAGDAFAPSPGDPISEPIGFVRDVWGKISNFQVTTRIWVHGLNNAGYVAGWGTGGVGFIRDPQGKITTFRCSDNSSVSVSGINNVGVVTGWCEGNNTSGGFVRSVQGAITTFEPPGAVRTLPWSINDLGAVAGVYYDANNVQHGFVRRPDGSHDIFTLPGVIQPLGQWWHAVPFDMNLAGEVAGTYIDANQIIHGFLRSRDGAMKKVEVRGNPAMVFGINAWGTVAGYYTDRDGSRHGFIDPRIGPTVIVDPPNSTDTAVYAINDLGIVAGSYHNPTATGQDKMFGFMRIGLP